jgi:hypothetical protein
MKLARPLVLAATLLLAPIALPQGEAAPSVADLVKDRIAAAEKVYTTSLVMFQTGRATADAVHTWSVRWLDAALDAAPKTAKQALADHQKRMADFEAEVQKGFAAGRVGPFDRDAAVYYRIEADLWVARGKR